MKKYAKNHFEEMTYNQKPFNSRRFHKELEEMEASGAIPFDDLNTKSWMKTLMKSRH